MRESKLSLNFCNLSHLSLIFTLFIFGKFLFFCKLNFRIDIINFLKIDKKINFTNLENMKTNELDQKYISNEEYEIYTKSTFYFDYTNPDFEFYFYQTFKEQLTPKENLILFYYKIRDEILYNPYSFKIGEKYYKASYITKLKKSFCIPKAILFTTVARKLGFPAKIGFSDVKNHLSSQRFLEYLKSDIFAFHGYSEIFIIEDNNPYKGKWIKVTPAFDKELCKKFNVEPLEFDGTKDSIFQQFNLANQKFMEYIQDRGSFDDFPYEYVLNGLLEFYPIFKNIKKIRGDLRKEI